MERRLKTAGTVIMVLGIVLYVVISAVPGILVMALGAACLVTVIFWPQLTGRTSDRKPYRRGDQWVDAILIVAAVVLVAVLDMPVLMLLALSGVTSLGFRYREIE